LIYCYTHTYIQLIYIKLDILHTSLEIMRAVATSQTSDNDMKSPNDDIRSAATTAEKHTHIQPINR